MILNVNNLTAKLDDEIVLDNINFATNENELLAVIGPSGAGKTTLLRCIAGLEKYEGDVLFDNINVNKTKTEKRNLGMVNQDLALFPHLTIYENIAYPLKIRKIGENNINEKVKAILKQFNISHLTKKLPQNVSGGEQQRTAIARALIYDPQLLLLDEPFAQLDLELRTQLMAWLKKVLQQKNILTLFVTHNIEEAKFISNRIMEVRDKNLKMI